MDGIRACVFDAYGTLLDVHSAVMRNAGAVGASADALSIAWRQRQLEYSWTRQLMGRYADFWQVTIDALEFALESYGLAGDEKLRTRLLDAYHELEAYSDAAPTLRAMKEHGFITAILSNGNRSMLDGATSAGNLDHLLDHSLSIDDIKIYKPDPRAYQLVCDRLHVQPHEVCFVSSNAWDVAGAAAFGFNSVRINRKADPIEYKFAPQKVQTSSLSDLSQLLAGGRQPSPEQRADGR